MHRSFQSPLRAARVGRVLSIQRAVVLRQPWAGLIVSGNLPIMVRKFPTSTRGWLGVFAAKSLDKDAGPLWGLEGRSPPLGVVIGAVRVTGCVTVPAGSTSYAAAKRLCGKQVADRYPPHYLPQRVGSGYLWMFDSTIETDRPVPIRMRKYPRLFIRSNVDLEVSRYHDVLSGRGGRRSRPSLTSRVAQEDDPEANDDALDALG